MDCPPLALFSRRFKPSGPTTTVEVSGRQSRLRSALNPLWFELAPTAPSSGLERRGHAAPSARVGPMFPPSPASSSAPRHRLRPPRHCEVDPNVDPAPLTLRALEIGRLAICVKVIDAARLSGISRSMVTYIFPWDGSNACICPKGEGGRLMNCLRCAGRWSFVFIRRVLICACGH
jgi:hypothetical protein